MATCSKYVMLVLGATLSDLEGEREPKTSLWNQSQIRFAAVLERKCSLLLQHLSRLQMMCLLGSEGAAQSSIILEVHRDVALGYFLLHEPFFMQTRVRAAILMAAEMQLQFCHLQIFSKLLHFSPSSSGCW